MTAGQQTSEARKKTETRRQVGAIRELAIETTHGEEPLTPESVRDASRANPTYTGMELQRTLRHLLRAAEYHDLVLDR